MTDVGWILRNEIIWYKRNCMPSSAKDRFTVDFEKLFFFTKSKKYWFEQQFEVLTDSTREDRRVKNSCFTQKRRHRGYPGDNPAQGTGMLRSVKPGLRNKRTVWDMDIPTKQGHEPHFATYPETLIEIPIKAGCPTDGIILDPFIGTGTTAKAALKLDRNFIGFELNLKDVERAEKKIQPLLQQTKLGF